MTEEKVGTGGGGGGGGVEVQNKTPHQLLIEKKYEGGQTERKEDHV